MNKVMLVLFTVFALVFTASTSYGLGFAANDSWNIGGGVGKLIAEVDSSSKLNYEVRAEIPAFSTLSFLSFIPGFAFELGLGMDNGFYFQAAPTVRIVLLKPLVVKAGGGMGVNFDHSWYAPVVGGLDIFVKDNICLTANVCMLMAAQGEIKNALRFNVGVAMAGKYEN